MRRFVSFLALIALVSGCHIGDSKDKPEPSTEDLVLRTYDVPSSQVQELRNLIANLMWKGENHPRIGNVGVAPTGQLLVSAPRSFQAGVSDLVSELKKAPLMTPTAIAIEYWIVEGVPAGQASVDDAVPADALPALSKFAGKQALRVWDHSRLVSLGNLWAKAERKALEIQQTAAVQDSKVIADLKINSQLGNVEVRAALPLEKSIVLAQAGRTEDGQDAAARGSVFYVVRASLEP